MDIQETLAQFMENKLILGESQSKLTADEPLLNGRLDSVNILRLVVFIEEQFHIQVLDEELVPENFQTVRKVAEYIQRKSAPGKS